MNSRHTAVSPTKLTILTHVQGEMSEYHGFLSPLRSSCRTPPHPCQPCNKVLNHILCKFYKDYSHTHKNHFQTITYYLLGLKNTDNKSSTLEAIT